MNELTHLLVEARDGDRDAFASAVRMAAPSVERFVRPTVDAADLDDVVQDTFVRAWGALHRFRVESTGMTWLLAIARRAAADAVRRHVRQCELSQRVESLRPAEVVVAETGRTELDDLVARLARDRREAFVLTQVVGLTYEEAAAVCGVPIGTIRSRVARARAELAAAWGTAAVPPHAQTA
jgi:RNA polymerase sigma-70 factor (ECF subfamily)